MTTMTWTKIGYELWTREEMIAVDRDAQLVHIEAMSWCNAHGTDGHIPKGVLRRVTTSPDPEGAAAQHVAAGGWEATATGWLIVHFLDHQPASEKVEKMQKSTAARQRRFRLHGNGDHTECLPESKCQYASDQQKQSPNRNGVSNGVTKASVTALQTPLRTVRPSDRKGGKDGPVKARSARTRKSVPTSPAGAVDSGHALARTSNTNGKVKTATGTPPSGEDMETVFTIKTLNPGNDPLLFRVTANHTDDIGKARAHELFRDAAMATNPWRRGYPKCGATVGSVDKPELTVTAVPVSRADEMRASLTELFAPEGVVLS